MLIDTIKKKQAHPLLSKIPDNLWSGFNYFNNSFNDNVLKINGKNFIDVVPDDLPANKFQAFIVLLINYSDIQIEQLIHFAKTKLQLTNEEIFAISVAMGHLDTLKWLAEQAPDRLMDMIQAHYYYAFRGACANGHLDTLKWLLQHPLCFAYAEQHQYEYSQHVIPFIKPVKPI